MRRYYDYPDMRFACWGDSLTSGYAFLLFSAAYNPARIVYNGGVGGDNLTQVTTRVLADNLYRDRISIVWDKLNSGENTTVYLQNMAAIIGHFNSDMYVVISGLYSTNGTQDPGSSWYIAQQTVNAAMAAAYGDHYLDLSVLLASDATRSDGVHPTDAALTTIAIPAIQAKLVALGYMNVTS